MINLANDPHANRPKARPTGNDGNGFSTESKRGRVGHAWPFPSRQAAHAPPQDRPQTPNNESGS